MIKMKFGGLYLASSIKMFKILQLFYSLNLIIFYQKLYEQFSNNNRKMVSISLLILSLLISAIHSDYRIDLNNPISLGNEKAINTLDYIQDQPYSEHFYVGFIDGTVRKLSADLASEQTFQTNEQVDKFYEHYFMFNHIMDDGTVNQISSFYVAVVCNNRTTLKLYTPNIFTQVDEYLHNQIILLYIGRPITYGQNVEFMHLLVGNETIRIVYGGNDTEIINYSSYGLNFVCQSAHQIQFDMDVSSGNTFAMSYQVQVLTTSNYNLLFYIDYQLIYNSSKGIYDMVIISAQCAGAQLLEYGYVVKTVQYNSQLIMQVEDTGDLYSHDVLTMEDYFFNSDIPKQELISLFSYSGDYYMLTITQLVLIYLTGSPKIYSKLFTISSFPESHFKHAFGSYFDLLLIPFTNKVYMASRCQAQEWFDGTSCISFTCNDANCAVCANLPSICNSCADNYSLTINGSCSSNTSSLSPFKPFSNDQSFNIFLILIKSFFIRKIYEAIKQTTMSVISIPAARRIASPLFYYFGNFDDLFLYSFHNRTYGETMKYFFGEINQIQAKNWSIVNYQTIVDFFGNSSAFDSFIGYQSAYLSATRVFTDGESHEPLSLVASCTNFFVVSLPITIVAFLALSLSFRLLFRFRVSQFLRKFDFAGFLFILLFEGNVQQFAFFLGFEWRVAFAPSFPTKLLKSSILLFGFALVCFSTIGYFLCYAVYKRLNKHFVDNNKNNLSGVTLLVIQNGVRNFILGMTHSLLRGADYDRLLWSLILIEAVSLVVFICSANNLNYQKVHSIWISISMTFIRLLLIATFLLDVENADSETIEKTQTMILISMISLYFGSVIVGVIGTIIEIITAIISLLWRKDMILTMANSRTQIVNKPCLSKRMRINPKENAIQKDNKTFKIKMVNEGQVKLRDQNYFGELG